jgi:hypothetical protein
VNPPAPTRISIVSSGVLSEVSNANEVERSDSLSLPSWIPLPVQGEGKRARRARVRAVATSTSRSACVRNGCVPKLLSRAVAGPISAYRHPVILLPHSWGRIQEGVQARALTPAGGQASTRSDFLTPEQSPISVILRVPRGESRLAEDRELGYSARTAHRVTNHG